MATHMIDSAKHPAAGSAKPCTCPVEYALKLIRGRWKKRIIYLISRKEMRFSEILKALDEISQPVLARELRELEASNLIMRVERSQMPPRIEYSLTSLGISLIPILVNLKNWGEYYINSSNSA